MQTLTTLQISNAQTEYRVMLDFIKMNSSTSPGSHYELSYFRMAKFIP